MRITESRIRRIIREEARRVLRESEEEYDEESESENTPDAVIDRFMDGPARMWMRVSNDFHSMADGSDMDGARDKYYPGWSDDDFRMVAKTLDKHFGM
jgi:hypothetical protein